MSVRIQKILFATDLTENSRYAFQYASALCARFGGRIVFLHVLTGLHGTAQGQIDLVAGEGTTERIRQAGLQHALERVRSALAEFYGGGATTLDAALESFEIAIREGEIAEEILKAASGFGCDLIVVGSHEGLMGGTAIGSKSKTLLRRAGIPVLVVPPANACPRLSGHAAGASARLEEGS